MKYRWGRGSQSAQVLFGLAMGCNASAGGGDTEGEDTTASETAEPQTDSEGEFAWLEIGWGEGQYVPLADGDAFPVVRGGQGAEMFPMPLRGAEFYLPGNPTTWMDENGPLVDVEIDIEGHNDGVGGHFKRIANYQLDWEIVEDGTYLSSYIPILIPDGVDSDELEGLPAHVLVRVRPHEEETIVRELDLVVTTQSVPPPG